MTSTGDMTACVQVISTAICTCWTSLVTRVINVGAPKVVNSGTLSSPLGEVDLQSGRDILLVRSTGAPGSDTPDVRGFTSQAADSTPGEYVFNTSDAIIDRLEGVYRKALDDPNIARLYAELGYFPTFRGRQEMAALLRQETEQWGAIIKEQNIQVD